MPLVLKAWCRTDGGSMAAAVHVDNTLLWRVRPLKSMNMGVRVASDGLASLHRVLVWRPAGTRRVHARRRRLRLVHQTPEQGARPEPPRACRKLHHLSGLEHHGQDDPRLCRRGGTAPFARRRDYTGQHLSRCPAIGSVATKFDFWPEPGLLRPPGSAPADTPGRGHRGDRRCTTLYHGARSRR